MKYESRSHGGSGFIACLAISHHPTKKSVRYTLRYLFSLSSDGWGPTAQFPSAKQADSRKKSFSRSGEYIDPLCGGSCTSYQRLSCCCCTLTCDLIDFPPSSLADSAIRQLLFFFFWLDMGTKMTRERKIVTYSTLACCKFMFVVRIGTRRSVL